jgi:membrane protein implicated in regulation of membrane protease activity
MDGRYREDKGKKHIDRLDFISDQLKKDETEPDDQLNTFEQESQLSEEALYYNICFGFLFFALLIVLATGYIKAGGLILYLLPAVILVCYAIYYRITIKSAMDKFEILKPKSPYPEESKEYEISKINYIKSRDLVLFQYSVLVRNFFTLFFPVLLYYIKVMVLSEGNSQMTWLLLIAFALASSFFWWQFFSKDINKYNSEIESHNNQINKLLAS